MRETLRSIAHASGIGVVRVFTHQSNDAPLRVPEHQPETATGFVDRTGLAQNHAAMRRHRLRQQRDLAS